MAETVSRRDVLQWGLSAMALSLVFAGCGGGGASAPGVGPTNISGVITLPTGLNSASLQIVSGLSDPVALTGGTFNAVVQGDVPSMVTVIDPASSKVAMFGMIDPNDSSHTLDATNVAATLMFMALGGPVMTADGRKPLLDAIKASPQLPTLAGIVQTQLNADPYALENANAQIIAGLSAATTGFAPAFVRPATASAKQVQSRQIQPQVLIDPGNEVDGATFVQATDTFGVAVQNTKRRYASAYTYLVAHVDKTGARTDVTPPLMVGQPLDIPQTASLLNLKSGWHPVTSASVPLSISGQDSKTIYEHIYLCPVYGGLDPSIFFLPRYASEVDKWKQTLSDLQGAVFVSFVTSFIFEGLMLAGGSWLLSELKPIIAGLTSVGSTVSDILVKAQGGYSLLPEVSDFLKIIAGGDNVILRNLYPKLAPLLQKVSAAQADQLAAGSLAAGRYIALQGAIRVFLAVGIVGIAADIAAVAKDTSTGNRGDLVTTTVFQPTVSISPANPFYTPGDTVNLSAVVPGAAKANLLYHWKYAGTNLASFTDGTNSGTEFDSSSANVSIETTPSTQGSMTVSVDVYDTSSGKTLLGSATANVNQNAAGNLTYLFVDTIDPLDPAPAGSSASYVQFPLDPTKFSQASIDFTIDGQRLYTYTANFPPASTPLPPSDPASWNSGKFTALGINNNFTYQAPGYHGGNEVYPFVFGDLGVVLVKSTGYGNSVPPPRPTLAQAEDITRAYVARVKIRITVKTSNSDPGTLYST